MVHELTIVPATADRWADLLRLFGPNGAYSNCWCTWWLLTNKDWETARATGRRALIEQMVAKGEVPGLLAYSGDGPIGWCALGPRGRYARMMSPRSPVFRPLDEEPSWVINCFFVTKGWRDRGVATALLKAAVEYALAQGAKRIDAYPKDPATQAISSAALFVGSLQMFLDAGFEEFARMNDRPVVRLTV